MAFAKGSKSVLSWKEESVYGTAPSGDWNQLPLNSETLDENINTIQGEDIRSDRRNPALRGGNIATGGNVVHDFGTTRTIGLFKHLLACTPASTTITPATLAAQAYKRGDYALNAGGDLFICLRGGTVSTTGALDAVTNGDTDVNNTSWRYVADTGYTFSLNKHLFKANVDFPAVGLSFEKGILGGNTNQYVAFTGGRVNSFELAVPQEGIAKATWNLLFSGSQNLGTSSGAGTPVIEGEDPVSGFDALIHLNDSGWDGDQTVFARANNREFSMTINNNVAEDVYVIGSRFRKDLPEGRRQASGRMALYFMDGVEYAYFKNETEISMALSFVHDGCYIIFKFPECKITGSGTPKISGQGVMQADFNWTAYYQDNLEETSGVDMVIEVHNKQEALTL